MSTQQATELHFRQLLNVLHRRWKVILTTGFIVAALVGTIGLIVPPRYTAKAQIVIDPQRGNGQPVAAGVLDEAAVETHVAMLLSDSHLKRLLDGLVAPRGADAGDIQGQQTSQTRATGSIQVPTVPSISKIPISSRLVPAIKALQMEDL